MTFFVYALFDSADWNTVKYVGVTSHLGRPLQHVGESKRVNRTRKHRSIRKLLRAGRHVGWKILEACDSWEEAIAAERRLILCHKERYGARPRWNFTDGGDGLYGTKRSAGTRARIGTANAVAWQRPEVRLARSKSLKAAWQRQETRAAHAAAPRSAGAVLADAVKAAWQRPETRAAHAAAWSAEKRAEHSKVLTASWTPERRAAHSKAQVAAWNHPERRMAARRRTTERSRLSGRFS